VFDQILKFECEKQSLGKIVQHPKETLAQVESNFAKSPGQKRNFDETEVWGTSDQ